MMVMDRQTNDVKLDMRIIFPRFFFRFHAMHRQSSIITSKYKKYFSWNLIAKY